MVVKTLSSVTFESGLDDGSTCSSDAGDILIRSTTTMAAVLSHRTDHKTQSRPNNTVRVHTGTSRRSEQPDHPPQMSNKDKLRQGNNRSMVDPSPVLEAQSPELVPQSPVLSDQLVHPAAHGQEVLTSRFPPRGREALSSALLQRSRSAPLRREVEVQLLDQVVSESGGCSSSCQQGAVTAATIAATAPLIQAQTQLEVRVSQLTEALRTLQDSSSPSGALGNSTSDHLLHRLEILQEQHLLLQRHLLDSACRTTTGHAHMTPDPRPTPHLSPHILTNQRPHTHSPWTSEETSDLQPAGPRRRASRVPVGTSPVSGSRTKTSSNPSTAAAQRANREEGGAVQSAARSPPGGSAPTMRPSSPAPPAPLFVPPPPSAPAPPAPLSEPPPPAAVAPPTPRSAPAPSPLSALSSIAPLSAPPVALAPPAPLSATPRSTPAPPPPPLAPSLVQEAALVLQDVRRRRKLLEENLDSMLRARDTETLHCLLDALSANRDCSEALRVRRTVDAWISSVSHDPQTSSPTAAPCRPGGAGGRGGPSLLPRKAGPRPLTNPRKPGSGMAGTGSGRPQPNPRGAPAPCRVQVQNHRGPLKKTPYIRLSSPGPRPRLVESVRGVQVKSIQTQTSLSEASPPSPRQPVQGVCSHASIARGDQRSKDWAGQRLPVAIALAEPTRHRPHGSNMAAVQVPSGSNMAAVEVPSGSNMAAVEVPSGSNMAAVEVPSGSNMAADLQILTERSEDEEEEALFPGAGFLSVVDVVQEDSPQEEQEVMEVSGRPSPPVAPYHGPAFPPSTSSAPLPAQDQAPVLGLLQRGDALENRLLEWVEQQVMTRVICHMYSPLTPDPALKDMSSQSEGEEDSTSGSHHSPDVSVVVSSPLLRRYVGEVLVETGKLMLTQRDPPGALTEPVDQLLVSTPVPTPVPSPVPDPVLVLPGPQTPPLQTPPLSGPPSPEPAEPQQNPSHTVADVELVATPSPTPEPLPLDNDPPILAEGTPDSHTHPLVKSASEEDPPLPPAPPPASPPPLPAQGNSTPGTGSCTSSTGSSATGISLNTSSLAGSGPADTAVRHISEGELLLSCCHHTEDGSFSSSLRELQEMDYDPPSEGQVRGHDPMLTLLARMDQEVTLSEPRPQPEGSWGEEEVSIGEVRGGLPPAEPGQQRTTNSHKTTNPRGLPLTNQGPVTIGDLKAEPISEAVMTSSPQSSQSPPPMESTPKSSRPLEVLRTQPTLVRPYDPAPLVEQEQEVVKVQVLLPSLINEEEEDEYN